MVRYRIYAPFVWVGMLKLRVNQTTVKAKPTESCRNTFYLTLITYFEFWIVFCFSCSRELMSWPQLFERRIALSTG